MQSMKAKFGSKCKVCGIEIKKGTTIQKVNEHWCSDENCVSKKVPTEKPKDQSTLTVSGPKLQAKTLNVKIPDENKDTYFIPGSPHEEAELIDRWAKERAWKITMESYADFNSLSRDTQRDLRIGANMREKILVDAVLRLYVLFGIKR